MIMFTLMLSGREALFNYSLDIVFPTIGVRGDFNIFQYKIWSMSSVEVW